jgi:hypothetical protein
VSDAGTWILERCASSRFPYRVQLLGHDGRPVLVLRAQDRWPAANRNIFCLNESEAPPEDEVLEEIERVPVTAVQRRGPRISVVLDRARYKRCDFLFLTRAYKTRPGETYQQVYWQTQTSMAQRRPRVAPVALRSRGAYTVRIASDERYPWLFPESTVERARLPAGDYALVDGDTVVAVVERKTLANLLHDLGVLPVLHQRLLELATYTYNALVIEAPYEDFLNPVRAQPYSASFCTAALGELYAAHPGLRIVFLSNRKTANLWTRSFFAAVWQQHVDGRGSGPTHGVQEIQDDHEEPNNHQHRDQESSLLSKGKDQAPLPMFGHLATRDGVLSKRGTHPRAPKVRHSQPVEGHGKQALGHLAGIEEHQAVKQAGRSKADDADPPRPRPEGPEPVGEVRIQR